MFSKTRLIHSFFHLSPLKFSSIQLYCKSIGYQFKHQINYRIGSLFLSDSNFQQLDSAKKFTCKVLLAYLNNTWNVKIVAIM